MARFHTLKIKDIRKETSDSVSVAFDIPAQIQPEFIPEYFSCLITTNRRIQIDDELFWDWEDDELTTIIIPLDKN